MHGPTTKLREVGVWVRASITKEIEVTKEGNATIEANVELQKITDQTSICIHSPVLRPNFDHIRKWPVPRGKFLESRLE